MRGRLALRTAGAPGQEQAPPSKSVIESGAGSLGPGLTWAAEPHPRRSYPLFEPQFLLSNKRATEMSKHYEGCRLVCWQGRAWEAAWRCCKMAGIELPHDLETPS